MTEAVTIADSNVIRRDLEYMTARWHELPTPVVFEVRCFAEGKKPQTFKFAPDWIDEAVDTIENMNGLGFNIYVVRNPIRADVQGSATDADIVASCFLWADCDDEGSASNVRRFAGPKYHAAVVTGKTPETRVHTYWELEEFVTDMAAWRDMQVAIAGHFNSDRSVINPSRIMRVGGTVAYPDSKKRARGYVKEVVAFRNDNAATRPRVTIEQMRRVFGSSAPQQSLAIDTGPQSLDRERTRIQALSGKEWHNAVIRLVGSYVSKGLSDDEIHGLTDPLTLPGYTVEQTRAEVQTAIDGARRKGWTPPQDEQFRELTAEERDAIPPALFRPWVARDLSTIPYPEFIYSDFYARGYTSLTIAAPKVGKSMLGLAEAIDMATGRGFLTGQKREPMRVVYYNAEDDQDVLDARIAALLTAYDIDQSELEGRFWPTSGVDAENFFLVSGQEGVINEALFVSIEKFCIEQKADVLIFDPLQDLSASPETNEVFRILGQRLRRMASSCGVGLGLIHHTRKIAPGLQATIEDSRGGSALRGTARFNRILSPMTEDEAAKAGVANHRFYFRIGDMESNLAPPSADVNRWFEKKSILTPNGMEIGAVAPWTWPDAFDGVTPQQAALVQAQIRQMPEPPKYDVQGKPWVGAIIAECLGLDIADKAIKARMKALRDGWIKTDVLRVEEIPNKRAGPDRVMKVVVAGENSPLVTGGQHG